MTRTSQPDDPGPITQLTLTFDNRHGGTYIVNCTVLYDTPDRPDHESLLRVSGGMIRSLNGIPASATNLRAKMDFVAGQTLLLTAGQPAADWPDGHGTIDLYGVWPFPCSAVWRTS